MLVLHVVLHVCCTCVARVLHVGWMCFLRYCFGVMKVLCWRQALEPCVEVAWQAQDFEWQVQHL